MSLNIMCLKRESGLEKSCRLFCVLALFPAPAWCGEASRNISAVPAPDSVQSMHADTQGQRPSEILITARRLPLSPALQIKRDKLDIVDAITADQIRKLPDRSVADVLQRIPGIQVAKDRGDSTTVSIRGLTQMETLLNGREVFSAGNGRNLDFTDLPAEMVNAVDVYKTSSADQIEGGIGGTIDVRTHRPFDFAGRKVIASVRINHASLAQQQKAQFSTLLSNRWQTGSGEVGALFNLAWQQRAFREDQMSAGAPITRSNIVSGQTVVASNGVSDSISVGTRERKSAGMVLQWQPADALKLYGEATYTEFLTRQDSYQFSASAPQTFLAGSPVLFPGSNDLQNITWTNANATTVGAARDTLDRTALFAVGGSWSGDRLKLKSDLSFTRSHNNLLYSAITLGGTAATLTQNQSGGTSSYSVGGNSLSSLAGYTSTGMWYASRPFDGDMKAARLDGEYRLDDAFFDKLETGLRIARRYATDAPGQVVDFPSGVVGNAAALAIASPYGNYLVGSPGAARNVTAARSTLGITGALPTSNPLGTWDIAENTRSGYLKTRFAQGALDGNAGMRVVNTQEAVSGYQGASGGPYSPLAFNSAYTDYLPSANLRYRLANELYVRAAASKSMTRQDFNQLSPSLTLNPVQLNGSAGNPALNPVRADNYDLALERYAASGASLHATAFWKRLKGYVTTVSTPETYGGLTYQVSRPQNMAGRQWIRGLELGYRQYYAGLPDWLPGRCRSFSLPSMCC